MNEPLISIALCTYNGEKFLKEQMDSILNQTYKNLEIVVVDDCSTDNSINVINSYASRDNRIKLFRNDVNLGFNKNFEKALTLTTGEYIAISDQDDIWLTDKIRLLFDNIKNNWLIFSNSNYMGGAKQGQLLKGDFKLPVSYKGILLRNYVSGHTSLLHRELLNYALPFPQKGYYDWWMGFIAAYHNKIAFLNEIVTLYRIHVDSVVQSRVEAGGIKLREHKDTLDMLDAFAGYKNIKSQDKGFIDKLKDVYRFRGSKEESMPLVKIISQNYSDLFPNRKPWKVLTKHFFARKYSKNL